MPRIAGRIKCLPHTEHGLQAQTGHDQSQHAPIRPPCLSPEIQNRAPTTGMVPNIIDLIPPFVEFNGTIYTEFKDNVYDAILSNIVLVRVSSTFADLVYF